MTEHLKHYLVAGLASHEQIRNAKRAAMREYYEMAIDACTAAAVPSTHKVQMRKVRR